MKHLISQEIINREMYRLFLKYHDIPKAEDFTKDDLALSLDDFSEKYLEPLFDEGMSREEYFGEDIAERIKQQAIKFMESM